jgi:hypothetical protein
MPIISGEWGYSTFSKGVTLETQAGFAVRQQLANLFAGVPISIWYDWKNDGPDPDEREHNFGVVAHDLKPKPAYIALQTMTHELNGFRIERRLETDDTNAFVLLFSHSSGTRKLAAWTAEPGSRAFSLTLPGDRASGTSATAVNGDGSPAKVHREHDRIEFEIAPLPKYIRLISSLTTTAPD